ncbi:hypothetical protein SERLADRAFT_441764 [Serpula lacrymans var. lacrymans S7.9]|uniref:Tyrosine specific protein phosphatases domain-containing protein n=1 Tax=Serpula lacrymans var. lacrymans (strain S7.9) TaxID=578457 RepID=F8P7K1_SERL9|nr:uncharacterized protein SERLADRAFT_441764 [Serpula lacrymans var. lacrymans S7.9]EGO21412.1 hypothetical protein SERLADRAFT_441764 [Serpula lacrymans var. lacrymans S7.9]
MAVETSSSESVHQNTESLVVPPQSSTIINNAEGTHARVADRRPWCIKINPDHIYRIIDPNKVIRSSHPLPPPFVNIDGVDNVRTIGHFHRSPSVKINTNLIYRSADPKGITEEGKTQLLRHGIKTVVDLRLEHEYDSIPGLPGVEWLSVPSEIQVAATTAQVTEMLENFQNTTVEAFIVVYAGVLESSGKVFELFFTHLRDEPNVPILVHCSAGKDRTGLAIALLLKILGVDDYDIIYDYALSSVGLGTAMPGLITSFGNNNEAYRKNPMGLLNFLGTSPDAMIMALHHMLKTYGGAEKYLTTHTSLRSSDIEKIRKNLLLTEG